MENKRKADRAKQFLPFDALKGYKEAILEKQIVKEDRKILSEDDEILLSNKLSMIHRGMMVKITYYDTYYYNTISGLVSKIDDITRTITIVKKTINIDDIIDIVIDDF